MQYYNNDDDDSDDEYDDNGNLIIPTCNICEASLTNKNIKSVGIAERSINA
jgi:hypothetical protein